MDERFEENLLEAVLMAHERGECTVETVRDLKDEEVTEEHVAALEKRGLLTREGSCLSLTDAGRAIAENVIRRHRLTEVLLYSLLGVEKERASQIGCIVEHDMQPEMVDGICTLLGHPSTCPHGGPIPPGPCCAEHQRVVEQLVVSLADLQPGRRARVLYIKPKNHERLHRLTAFGLTPGVELELHQQRPAYCIRYEGTELALDRDVAEDIFVAPIEGGEPESDRPVAGHGRGRRRGRGWRGWGWGRRGGRRRG